MNTGRPDAASWVDSIREPSARSMANGGGVSPAFVPSGAGAGAVGGSVVGGSVVGNVVAVAAGAAALVGRGDAVGSGVGDGDVSVGDAGAWVCGGGGSVVGAEAGGACAVGVDVEITELDVGSGDADAGACVGIPGATAGSSSSGVQPEATTSSAAVNRAANVALIVFTVCAWRCQRHRQITLINSEAEYPSDAALLPVALLLPRERSRGLPPAGPGMPAIPRRRPWFGGAGSGRGRSAR